MALFEVVKYDGTPDVYAWKYPNEEISTWTQLVVNESQEAILFKNGQAFDTFQAGRHTLSTMNIPLLNKVINLPFGGQSPFAAEVWYVNKVNNLDVKWGTTSPIQLQDPKYNIIVPVRAFGQMGIRIEDSRRFLIKLVGTLPKFELSDISRYFRGVLLMNINECISSYLVHRKISILEINAYISEISTFVQERMAPVFAEYGIAVVNMFVDSINTPDEDISVQRLREALAKKAEMDIIGYTYQQERSFDTLEGAAKNEGSMQSGMMGAGLGLGMGVGMGGPLGQLMGQVGRVMEVNTSTVSSSTTSTNMQPCNHCGQPLIAGSKFCHHCGDAYLACEHCGADNPEGATECKSCGKGLSRPCGQCGASLKADARFCHACGTQTTTACTNCGKPMQPGQKFCIECGHSAPQQGGQG